MAKTFIRNGEIIGINDLKKGDVFYYYEGDFSDVTEYRLYKVLGETGDGGFSCQPLPVIVLGDKMKSSEV